MTNEEYSKIIIEIKTLPTGGIIYKKINGKEYTHISFDDAEEELKRKEEIEKKSDAKEVSQKMFKVV